MEWTETDRHCLKVVKDALQELNENWGTTKYDRYIKWMDSLYIRTADKKPFFTRLWYNIRRCRIAIRLELSYDEDSGKYILSDEQRQELMRKIESLRIKSLK